MKRIYFKVFTLFSLLLFIACSKDNVGNNDNNGNNSDEEVVDEDKDDNNDNSGDNGDGGNIGEDNEVQILEKKIVQILEYESDRLIPEFFKNAYKFVYDKDDKLIEILEGKGTEARKTVSFVYKDNSIDVIEYQSNGSDVKDVKEIYLNNGRAEKYIGSDKEILFSYTGNYISRMEYPKEAYYSDFEVHNGNVTKIKDSNKNYVTIVESFKPNYKSSLNDTNIDLYGYIILDKNYPVMLGVAGNRFKNLPIDISLYINNQFYGSTVYMYEKNEERYLTKFTKINYMGLNHVTTYVINYEG